MVSSAVGFAPGTVGLCEGCRPWCRLGAGGRGGAGGSGCADWRSRAGGGSLFGFDKLAQDAPEVCEWSIRQNPKHLEPRIFFDGLLLALDDRLVLHKPFNQAVEQRSGNGRVITLEVVQIGPEKVRGAVGLRRHVLTVAVLPRVLDITFLRPLARGRERRLH